MIVYQETTVWPEGDNANHIYVLKAKPTGRTVEAVAYVHADPIVYRSSASLSLWISKEEPLDRLTEPPNGAIIHT